MGSGNSVCVICEGHIDDLFPYFMKHAKTMFPHLDCMDDLQKISDLRHPANWFVLACFVDAISKSFHAVEKVVLWCRFSCLFCLDVSWKVLFVVDVKALLFNVHHHHLDHYKVASWVKCKSIWLSSGTDFVVKLSNE